MDLPLFRKSIIVFSKVKNFVPVNIYNKAKCAWILFQKSITVNNNNYLITDILPRKKVFSVFFLDMNAHSVCRHLYSRGNNLTNKIYLYSFV